MNAFLVLAFLLTTIMLYYATMTLQRSCAARDHYLGEMVKQSRRQSQESSELSNQLLDMLQDRQDGQNDMDDDASDDSGDHNAYDEYAASKDSLLQHLQKMNILTYTKERMPGISSWYCNNDYCAYDLPEELLLPSSSFASFGAAQDDALAESNPTTPPDTIPDVVRSSPEEEVEKSSTKQAASPEAAPAKKRRIRKSNKPTADAILPPVL